MRIVVPGGTGQVGGVLRRAMAAAGHEVVVLSRHPERRLEPGVRHVGWDGRTVGGWAEELDGADAVVNLAGRTVSCRYTDENLRQMMHSRVDSTRAVGEAVRRAARPPRVWLQMSTATVYADRSDQPGNPPNDEATGRLGGDEPHVPLYWEYSVRIARRWEEAQAELDLPATRRVALRSAMVMSPDAGGVFDVLLRLARLGLGGPVAGGHQYVSWIHDRDFVRAVTHLVDGELSGPVNLAAPGPVPQRELMAGLRTAWGGWAGRVGVPATAGMAGLGAWAMRSDPELLLKSRRVVPGRLLADGFDFTYPEWPAAARDLVARVRDERGRGRTPSAQTSRPATSGV